MSGSEARTDTERLDWLERNGRNLVFGSDDLGVDGRWCLRDFWVEFKTLRELADWGIAKDLEEST